MTTEDRRAPGATRMPFEGLVEVGGALGPSFEAQAVNVSEDGIHLRTAYLPEQGQPLTCRFDGGPGQSVLASGEVVWAAGADKGGEFGVRFTDMDQESVDSLKKIIGVPGVEHAVVTGSKVRLHIDGLASPMRAKIKDARATAVTVGSDLGFLQVGRQLELEDAQSGAKRPACIDRVDVAVDPTSNVPQLVVTLRYSDVAEAPAGVGIPIAAPAFAAVPPSPPGDDLASAEEASRRMKGAVAHTIAQMGPALGRMAERAKTMAVLLAKRRTERKDEASTGRRTTAPPPNGGLYTSGRRVLRGNEGSPSSPEGVLPAPFRTHKAKAVVAGAVMVTAIVGALALKKSHNVDAQAQAQAAAAAASAAPEASASALAAAPPPPAAAPSAALAPPAPPETLAAADETSDTTTKSHKKHVHVPPFGNGPVHHGNVLRLKMDGAIELLEGAQQPTGFTVKLPGRRSLEAAAPLAARDTRIAAIKVANDTAGAELTVTFKDGVPNYQVSARGDSLIISLAPVGDLDEKVAKSSKHKHAR